MLKIYSFIQNPKSLLLGCAIFFVIALIDSLINNASSFETLSIIGKIGTILLIVPFTYLIFTFMLKPIWKALVSYFM